MNRSPVPLSLGATQAIEMDKASVLVMLQTFAVKFLT